MLVIFQRAQGFEIDTEIMQIKCRFFADEFTADLVMRARLALDQHSRAPCPRELYCQCAPGDAAADDHGLRRFHAALQRDTQRRKGNIQRISTSEAGTPAATTIASQSDRVNARAMEIGPSCCTNSWKRSARETVRKK